MERQEKIKTLMETLGGAISEDTGEQLLAEAPLIYRRLMFTYPRRLNSSLPNRNILSFFMHEPGRLPDQRESQGLECTKALAAFVPYKLLEKTFISPNYTRLVNLCP